MTGGECLTVKRTCDGMSNMTTTQEFSPIYLDSGQIAMVRSDPYAISYECPGCHTFSDDTTPHSHFDGERWVRMHYCADCIEASL